MSTRLQLKIKILKGKKNWLYFRRQEWGKAIWISGRRYKATKTEMVKLNLCDEKLPVIGCGVYS